MDTREIDALIAEKVMGWKLSKQQISIEGWADVWRNEDGEIMAYDREWKPTSEISDAWQVEEKIHSEAGPEIAAYIVALNEITFGDFYAGRALDNYGTLWRMVHASPLNRCLAALEAVGVEVQTLLRP